MVIAIGATERYARHVQCCNQTWAFGRKSPTSKSGVRRKVPWGGVAFRLSEFDPPEDARNQLYLAKQHYEDVRAACSEHVLPKHFGMASALLATVLGDRNLASSDSEYVDNLRRSIGLYLLALSFVSEVRDAEDWGKIQHNLGLAYTELAKA